MSNKQGVGGWRYAQGHMCCAVTGKQEQEPARLISLACTIGSWNNKGKREAFVSLEHGGG